MNEPETIKRILSMKTIAVVGLSGNAEKPSCRVASYLQGHGYEIIPVNPTISEWKGKRCYPRLEDVPVKIDVVDIFRRSEDVPPVVKGAIAVGAKAVWMQERIVNETAGKEAERAGLLVVMDRCIMKEKERANG